MNIYMIVDHSVLGVRKYRFCRTIMKALEIAEEITKSWSSPGVVYGRAEYKKMNYMNFCNSIKDHDCVIVNTKNHIDDYQISITRAIIE